MYEDQTSQVIEKRMLDTVSPAVDKREGSIIHDATAPVSIELELMYAALDWFMKNTFGDTAERKFLIERALERGLVPYKATRAVVRGIFTPSALEIPIGHRFSCDGINYAVTEKLKAGSYLLRCETAGVSGNKEAGMLVPIDNLPDLQSAKIEALTIPAIDDEDTEVFRQRYLKSFETQAYGGNIADYKEKVLSLPVWAASKCTRSGTAEARLKSYFAHPNLNRPTVNLWTKCRKCWIRFLITRKASV